MRVRPCHLIGGCLALQLAATGAQAAGFFLQEQSVRGLGRANAGAAAAAEDASTIFFNPAGLTQLGRPELALGGHLLIPRGDLDDRGSTATSVGTGGAAAGLSGGDGGNPFTTTALPNLFAAVPLLEGRLAFGLGVTSPWGLSTDYGDDWFGRYDSTSSDLTSLDIAASAAVAVAPWLSLGAGLDVQYAKIKLVNALPDPLALGGPTPATDGRFEAEGDSWALGYNLGVLVKPLPDLRVGLHYRSKMEHEFDGHARFSGLSGPLAGQNRKTGASGKAEFPDSVALGLAYAATPRLTVLAQLGWFGWDRLEELRLVLDDGAPDVVTELDYRDTWQVAVGVEYRLTDAWTLRAGAQYDQSPVEDSTRDTRVPDADRYWLAGGASYAVEDWLSVDLAYAHLFSPGGTIDREREFYEGTPAATAVRTRARADATVDIVSLQLRLLF